MRILAVTPYYEPEGGGLERYAHAILSRLARRGHDVAALAFTKKGARETIRDGVRIECFSPLLRIGNSPIDFGFSAKVSRTIESHRPDVVLAHTPVPFPAEMAYRSATKAAVPFVATYHAGRLRGSSWTLGRLALIHRATLERRMLAGASRLIAVSPYVRDHALSDHADRVRIVPPGVDAQHFRPNGANRSSNILFVGPVSQAYHWKGLDILWSAFRHVRQRIPDARLTVVGAGDRNAEFREKARGLGDAVVFKGRLSEDELVGEYQRAAVVALPSTTDAESFGMVLAEANACARPVVASRIGGIPDFVVDGDNGLLVRPGDANDLAAKLVTLLRDDELAQTMGRRGRARVVKEHDWEPLTAATETVLDEARVVVARH
ncbi:MAG TPA: glycosyltransferase family 4 protein [Candidatus Thermoplasmatota archaeon]|nr:glycosyltransferase family 4 protein [Candidatus Thermoplasmatota archaeon]